MGNADVSKFDRDSLSNDLIRLHSDLIRMAESYNEQLNSYVVSLRQLLDSSTSFFEKNDLMKVHLDKKMVALEEVWFSIFYIK